MSLGLRVQSLGFIPLVIPEKQIEADSETGFIQGLQGTILS